MIVVTVENMSSLFMMLLQTVVCDVRCVAGTLAEAAQLHRQERSQHVHHCLPLCKLQSNLPVFPITASKIHLHFNIFLAYCQVQQHKVRSVLLIRLLAGSYQRPS